MFDQEEWLTGLSKMWSLNNLRYADDITLMAESEEELKSLLMKVKDSEKVGLKLSIQKTKIIASGPISQSVSPVSQSVQLLSCVWVFATLWTAAGQASLSITNSWSSHRLTSIESVMPSSHLILCRPFFSCHQSLPASESFPMSQLFTWGGQSTGVSALASFPPKNTQHWSSEWTGWISLQSKGLSRVFSNTTVQKHQFFGAQLSSQSNSHIHTWPLEKPYTWLDEPLLAKWCLCFWICYLGLSYLSFQGVSVF